MPADVSSAILRASLQPYAKYDRGLEESLNSLQTTQQQMQELNQQMQQAQQESQQAKQASQYWQSIATDLQNKSAEAGAQQKQADAGKKVAETEEIRSKLPDQALQPQKTEAEVFQIYALADSLMNKDQDGQP